MYRDFKRTKFAKPKEEQLHWYWNRNGNLKRMDKKACIIKGQDDQRYVFRRIQNDGKK